MPTPVLAGYPGRARSTHLRLAVAGLAACLLVPACARKASQVRLDQTHAARSSNARLASDAAARGIPFRLVDDQIVLSVTINGRVSVDMVLDTGFGSEGVLLLDPELGRRVGLEYVQSVQLGGGGSSEGTAAHVAVGATLDLPGVTFSNQPLVVLDDGSGCADWPVKGIIGGTLMARPVEIDYEARVLHILGTLPDPPSGLGEALGLTFVQGIPAVRATVVTEKGQEVPVELLVDTGTNDALLLRPGSHPQLRLPERVIAGTSGVLGEGLGGGMKGSLGRVAGLRFGHFSFDQVVTVFLDEEAMGTASTLGGNGLLANEVLQRFTVVFDYAGKRLFLRPNSSYPRPFEFDMAGLVLQARGDGSFTVLDVIQQSPAARQGLAGGDVLVAIDGKDVRALASEAVFSMLRQLGRHVEITIDRGGTRLTRTVTLARLI